MSRVNALKSVLPFAVVVGFVACSSSEEPNKAAPPTTGDVVDGGSDAPSSCTEPNTCSADSRSVVGCAGDVVETCSEATGCFGGKCVPACESAAAARGANGCSFWAVPPDVKSDAEASCYVAFVTNAWTTPAKVTAEYGSEALDVSKSVYRAKMTAEGHIAYEALDGAVPAGETGLVFLAQGDEPPGNDKWIGCPSGVNVAYRGVAVKDHRTSIYKAFHLSTDVPVAAAAIFPYGGAKSNYPSATSLAPSTSSGSNYLLVDGWSPQTSFGNPFIQIVAQEDDTEVQMRPVVDIKDVPGIPGSPKGFTGKWTLKRGEVLEVSQASNLGGTPVVSNRPVAVFGGHQCATVPDNVMDCDSLHQQIAPLTQWASTHSAVPYQSRRVALQGSPAAAEVVTWKIVGAYDGTALTYEPSAPFGAPDTLSAGQVATFTTDVPFTVKSQSNDFPIYLAVYMSGGDKYTSAGDPDFVSIVPDDQFLDHYVFFADYTYANTNLTLVRRKDESGFHDVKLDCLGAVTGWKPLAKDGSTEYAWVDLTQGRAPVGSCSYGRHEASSEGTFGLYVWGEDARASYGYSVGGSQSTSTVPVPVP